MKKNLTGDIVVLPLNKFSVDVFTGKGWDNWTRFEYAWSRESNKPFLRKKAGVPVFEHEYAKLMEML